MFTFEVVDKDGKVWDRFTVKAPTLQDAAKAIGHYPGKYVVLI